MRPLRAASLLLLTALLAACASRSHQVVARPADPALYAGWGCERLLDELDAVQARAADVAYAVDARVGNNLIALGVGVTVFWPALLAMRPDGDEAAELARLKGHFEVLSRLSAAQACTARGSVLPEGRMAALPLAVGERIVYEQRAGLSPAVQLLGMRLRAAQRDGLEFEVDVDGKRLDGHWRQDAAGNTELDGRVAQIGWRRLLRPGLQLGQVLTGELAAAGHAQSGARVRGQVVAVGPQVLDGRAFEVAVIELFGDAPQSGASSALATGSTRIDGVMAVDRRSGLLLRLELRCGNPEFTINRRLLRIEPAG